MEHKPNTKYSMGDSGKHSQTRFWRKMCCHLDGVAIGAAVEALADRGLLGRLEKACGPLAVDVLAAEFGARPGYLHVALRALADQGFVTLAPLGHPAALGIEMTDAGRAWLSFLSYYKGAARRAAAAALLQRIVEHAPHATSIDVPLLPDQPYPSTGSAMEERAWLQACGPTVAGIASELFSRGMLHLMSSSIGLPIDAKGGATGAGAVWSLLLDVIKAHGWAERRGDRWHLTDEGMPLATSAPQYFYSVSYLPLAARLGSLLFPDVKPPKESDGRSVDRSLDIRFSGMVFEKTCKTKFLELALPVFQQEPLERQPAAVVDMGCGDGTMLIELFHAIKEKTKRGQRLDECPLTMVGADYSSEALETARRRMKERGIPGFCVPGDIGDPDALAEHLTAHGVDPHDVLQISKSVIHNRSYLHSSAPSPALPSATRPTTVFALPDGSATPAEDVERSLVDLFRKWLPWMRRHGMIAIEAHSVPSSIVAATAGLNPWTGLHALHGFSNQYLLDAPAFRRATETAGLRVEGERTLVAADKNWPILVAWRLSDG